MNAPSVGVEEEFLLVDPHTGEPVAKNSDVADNCASAPTSRVLGMWLTTLQAALQELGDDEWVRAEVARLLQDGNGAMRQRQAWRTRGEIADVVAVAAAATVRLA